LAVGDVLLPDFYEILGILPGHEAEMFTATLWSVLELEHERVVPECGEFEKRLARFYASHACENHRDSFPEAAVAEEVKHTSTATLETFGSMSFVHHPADAEEGPAHLKSLVTFYGFASDQDGREFQRWSSDAHVQRLHLLALDECRRSGSLPVPPHWTPSTLSHMVGNHFWAATVRDSRAFYTSLETERFKALTEYAQSLLTDERVPWMVELHGPGWDPSKTKEEISLYAWDSVMTYQANGRYPEAVDALGILACAGPGHRRLERAVVELLESPEPAVRLRAVNIAAEFMTPGLLEGCTRRALVEEHRVILEHLVRALRVLGGAGGFDALMQVGREAVSNFARDSAARALAWVPRYPQRIERLRDFGKSRDRSAVRVASKALAEAKNHGLFSREGEFASRPERALHDALQAYLQSQDSGAARILDDAFRFGWLRVETRNTHPRQVTIVTDEEVPLHTEELRVREMLGWLSQLPSVDLRGDRLSPEELEAEAFLRRAFRHDDDLKFPSEDRVKLFRALSSASEDFRPAALHMANAFWEQAQKESPSTRLGSDPIDDAQFHTTVLLLRAIPRFSVGVRHVFLKGLRTGDPERIERVRAECPNLETYWGYADRYPENASAHAALWTEMCNDVEHYDRLRLDRLPESQHVVLWSRARGWMPSG
jgi:hypothetical protein